MPKTILVALDDSDLSDQVVQMVLELPLTKDSKVVLSHVVARTEADQDVVADRPHDAQDLSYRQLEKRLQAYQGQFSCVTELEIALGDPAEEIIRLSNIYQADAVGQKIDGQLGRAGKRSISAAASRPTPPVVKIAAIATADQPSRRGRRVTAVAPVADGEPFTPAVGGSAGLDARDGLGGWAEFPAFGGRRGPRPVAPTARGRESGGQRSGSLGFLVIATP